MRYCLSQNDWNIGFLVGSYWNRTNYRLLGWLIYSQLFYHRTHDPDSGTRNRTKISGVWALCPKPLDDPAAEGERFELTRPLLVTRFSRPAPSPIGLTFLIQHKFSKNDSQLRRCEKFGRGCRNWTCLNVLFPKQATRLESDPRCCYRCYSNYLASSLFLSVVQKRFELSLDGLSNHCLCRLGYWTVF